MAAHRHHHQRPLGRRMSQWLNICQERYNLFWQQLMLRWRRPRVVESSEVLSDGRIKKKISTSMPRPIGNFSFSRSSTIFNAPFLLLLIFLLILFFIFGEALSNRQQIYNMMTGSKNPVPDNLDVR